jgi:hypothetical protein
MKVSLRPYVEVPQRAIREPAPPVALRGFLRQRLFWTANMTAMECSADQIGKATIVVHKRHAAGARLSRSPVIAAAM